jgi:hypothetical protein
MQAFPYNSMFPGADGDRRSLGQVLAKRPKSALKRVKIALA